MASGTIQPAFIRQTYQVTQDVAANSQGSVAVPLNIPEGYEIGSATVFSSHSHVMTAYSGGNLTRIFIWYYNNTATARPSEIFNVVLLLVKS